MKTCSKCKKGKPFSNFYKDTKSRRKDGYYPRCKECVRMYRRKYYHPQPDFKSKNRKNRDKLLKRNRQFIHEYLSKNPCVDCGISIIEVLEFDHVRGEKSKNICDMVANCSLEKIQEEITKCDVRCANCHKLKTIKQFNYYSYLAM